MNAKFRIIATLSSLGIMLFSFNHCVLEQKTNTKKDTGTSNTTTSAAPTTEAENPVSPPPTTPVPPVSPPPAPTPPDIGNPGDIPPEVIQAQEIDLGVKNFEQINETMSVLTGVDPSTRDIENTFEELEVQLPGDNNIKSFLSANQVAITKLAAEYCDVLVDDGTLRAQVWPGLNFSNSPNQVLSNNAQKLGVIIQTLDKFWGMTTDNRATSETEMLSLMNDLLAGENLGNRGTTATVMKGVCTAALASAEVTLM